MADDQRMHDSGNTPGLVPGRGRERHEEPVTEADAIGTEHAPPQGPAAGAGPASADDRDRDQTLQSASGGEAAARSGVGDMAADER